MTAVASGDLNHRVEIQYPQITQNPTTGEMVATWTTLAMVWASVQFQSVREFRSAAAEQSEVRGYAVIRYRDDVDATMRIVHRRKYYGILGVMPDNDSGKEHLTLALAEGVRLDQ